MPFQRLTGNSLKVFPCVSIKFLKPDKLSAEPKCASIPIIASGSRVLALTVSGVITCVGSCKTICALLPPKPKTLTPAVLGFVA